MKYIAWAIVLALLVPMLAACGGGSGGSIGASTGGMLRVSVTDEPFPIEGVLEATVMIGRVEAHLQEEGRWIVLSEEEFTINLVGLTNGIVEEIINVAVDAGTYDKFRFITGPGQVVLDASKGAVADERFKDEDTGNYVFTTKNGGLKFPSGPQTGIKVDVDPPIVVGTETSGLSGDLLLEYDLGENFVFNGPVYRMPGVIRVLFTPSVKASNTSVNGSVVVIVTDDAATELEGAEVWLDNGAKVTHTFTDEFGVARLSALPGTYTLKADKCGFVEGSIANVEIVLANLTDAGTLALNPANTVFTTVDTADTADDYPVAGVSVTLAPADASISPNPAMTDSCGEFGFNGLVGTTMYTLTFEKTGFTTQVVSWTLDTDSVLNVLLDPLDQVVEATVKDAGSAAVSGADVTATDSFGNTWMVTAGTDGVASFTLPTGTYTFTALDGSMNSYEAAADLVVVGDTDAATKDTIELQPAPSAP